MKPTITAREHYDRLSEASHGHEDPPHMLKYMARWDGPPFWDALGDLRRMDVLEVGIGWCRIARQVLERGCRSLTGLDISPKSIAAAASNLRGFPNLEVVLADITEFSRPDSYDAAYSVLTFMHVQDKQKALQNIVASLRPGGHVVLSISRESDTLDFGDYLVALHPWQPEQYADALARLGCEVADLIPLTDTWIERSGKRSDTYGEAIATLVKATKK